MMRTLRDPRPGSETGADVPPIRPADTLPGLPWDILPRDILPGPATPVGAALVARAVLRVRLRRVLDDATVAQAIAAALSRRASRRDIGGPR